jgi:hypothetical protein
MQATRFLSFLAGLGCVATSLVHADTLYNAQRVISLGDTIGSRKASGKLHLGALNDSGQVVFVADDTDGSELLIQYAEGVLRPIVAAGDDALGGSWPADIRIYSPVRMNQFGNVAFTAPITVEGETSLSTFRWDRETQKITTVARRGMPVGENIVLEQAGEWPPSINNQNEVAFQAQVKDAAGEVKEAVFLLTRDDQVVAVGLPGHKSPNGATCESVYFESLNDAGVTAFTSLWEKTVGGGTGGSYLWEKGGITQVSGPGTRFKKISSNPPSIGWVGVWVNNKDQTVLLWTNHFVRGRAELSLGLLRLVNDALTPIIVPGQKLPDGEKLVTVDWVSAPNEAGQHAFVARLENQRDAVYLLSLDGTITPLLRSGTTNEAGTITKILGSIEKDRESFGLGVNTPGQVALVVQIDNGPDTILLLTPTRVQPQAERQP